MTEDIEGAVFWIVTEVELVVSVEPVHVLATAVCSQIIESPFTKLDEARVCDVAPPITPSFLYHFHVHAPVFSVSPSGSDHEPGLQVNVELVFGNAGVILGAPSVGAWSGYELLAPEVSTYSSPVSLNPTTIVELPGVDEEQLYLT